LSDFSEIFYEEAERRADKSHVTKAANFSEFDEIWCATADIEPYDSHMTTN